jgi:hypothetical protein
LVPTTALTLGTAAAVSCLLGGERFAAAFEALPAGGVHRQHGAYGGVELLDFGCDSLVGHEHGQSQADGNSQHGNNRCRSDFVSEGIAYTSGKDAHVTPMVPVSA